MIGKLICCGKDRRDAINVVKRALDEYIVEPIKTTIPFHKKVFSNQRFLQARFYTDFIDRMLEEETNTKK
jgi:acetyl-CoA carboxylase biotin carboxylase subunit